MKISKLKFAMISLAGAVAGLAVSFLVPQRFVSTAVFLLEGGDQPTLMTTYRRLTNSVLSRASLSNVIQNPRLQLYPRDLANKPLDDVIETMRRDVRVTPLNPGAASGAFQLSFVYTDRFKAQAANQQLISRFVEELQVNQTGEVGRLQVLLRRIAQLESRIDALEHRSGGASTNAPTPLADSIYLEVLDPPGLPIKPISPNRWVFIAMGLGVGLAASGFAGTRRGRI